MLGCFGLGISLSSPLTAEDNFTAKADLTNYDSVQNTLPEFVKLENTARKSFENYVFLTNNSSEIDLKIAADEKMLISHKTPAGIIDGQNYAYIPSSDLNIEDDPTTPDIDESKTEYYYFSFSNSLSLYYNLTNKDIENGTEGLDNILNGENIDLFATSKETAFPIQTYDFTPEKFEISFKLNTAISGDKIINGHTVSLKKEGCYTLALPLTYYHTTNNGQTFSTTSEVIYYTFMLFDYTTYFDSASELPTSSMQNTTVSHLTNSESHSTYYFYNYDKTNLPAFSYQPRKEQISVQFTDTDSNSFTRIIEFNPFTNIITQKDENGNETSDDKLFATYNSADGKITLTFNDLGEYDISYTFLYVSQNTVYKIPLTAKRQRLYNYGYQAFYTDYSKLDPNTNTTIPQEFKNISEDKTKFLNSADVTYLLSNNQHVSTTYDLDTLKQDAVDAINSSDVKPVSTNQTPVKFSSNAAKKGSKKYTLDAVTGEFDNGSIYDGSNINDAGTYLIVLDYSYNNYLSTSGTAQSSYHHYQIFYFTVENKTPSVTVVDEKGQNIHTKGYTNKSVFIVDDSAATLFDAKVRITLTAQDYLTGKYVFPETNIEDFKMGQYGITYYDGDMAVPGDKFNITDESGKITTLYQTGVYIDASKANAYRNAHYTINIYTENSKLPSSRSFTIDTNGITNLKAQNVRYSTSSTYSIVSDVNGGKTNQPIIFSWDNKISGAQTYGYYKYFELKSTQYYKGGDDDSLLLYSLIGSQEPFDILPVNAYLDLNSSSNQWTNYVNAVDYKTIVPSTYVRDQAGVYVFEVFDEAGNSNFELFFIDNTSPLFVKKIESQSSTIRSILSSNDTITVSEVYTASIEWANYKGIYLQELSETGRLNLYKSFVNDKLDKDENGRVELLKNKIDEFLSDNNVTTISGISGSTPNPEILPSYNAQYLKVKVSDNFYLKDSESSKYTEQTGNSYTIEFFTGTGEDKKEKEGTYKFLLRDESNTNYSDNEYGFLNYPSSFLTLNVTSDASQLEVLLEGNPVDKQGYTLTGNFYQKTENDVTYYSKTQDEGFNTESKLTYKYAYNIPVKTEKALRISYIPVADNGSRIKNIKVLYYGYVKASKTITAYNDGKPFDATAWYYTLSDTVTREIDIFNYSQTESYEEGVKRDYLLTFSGSGIAEAGKYVIIRTYFEDSTIDKYDYYERDLTLYVDRYNVISAQENVTTDINGSTTSSLESIVGGDILISMYSGTDQQALQVAFPSYNPNTHLNSGSFFTKNIFDENLDTIITTKPSTNKLPLSVYIPQYKYTENYAYDYANNSYSVIENNTLSRLGNSIIEVVEKPDETVYNLIVEGIKVGTYYTLEEAEAARAKTDIEEYKLNAFIKFKSTSSNKTYYYKTNGTTNGGYLNFYKVSTIDETVPADAEPCVFSETGIYNVIIYQGYYGGNTGEEGSFRDFYRFAFEILDPEPEFTILNENGIELNSVNGDYYTNSQTIEVQWEDSTSEYIANLNRNVNAIAIVKDDGSTVLLKDSDIKTHGLVHSFTLNLNDINLWAEGRSLSITMQLEGYTDNRGTLTKRVFVDYSAPIQNLARLMDNVTNSSGVFGRLYQEINSRRLLDFDSNEIDTSVWTNANYLTNLSRVSYSYSASSGVMKYYAYNVEKSFFTDLKRSINAADPTSVQNIYYNRITNYADYIQVDKSGFSEMNYTNVAYIEEDEADLIPNDYYEIVEIDTAGNMVVYVVHIYEKDHLDAGQQTYALTYENALYNGDEYIAILDSSLENEGNIYSNTGFKITSLNYLSDSWGIYRITVNGVTSIYMNSPWLTSDANDSYIYQIRSVNGTLTYTQIPLSDLFANITSSKYKHTLSLSNRYQGNLVTVYIGIMDASLNTTKYSDEATATLNIFVPTNEQANSTTEAYLYPTEIKMYQFLTVDESWHLISNIINLTGNPLNWLSDNDNIKYSYTNGILSITTSLAAFSSTKLKYEIKDNFGNITSVIQLVNEETCDEIIGNETIYESHEPDSITYLSSSDMTYQYNRLLYQVKIEKYNGSTFHELSEKELREESIVKGNYLNTNINYYRFQTGYEINYDKVYRISVYEIESNLETDHPVRIINVRLYYKLPSLQTTATKPDNNTIKITDKNADIISEHGTQRNVSVSKDGVIYTADATTINTYSNTITVNFDDGQFGLSNDKYSYLQQYPYSIYFSENGKDWVNINGFASSGYRINGSGNYKLLVTYDNTEIFTNLCKIFDITIIDSSSVFYYITVDGNLITKSDIKYTDPSGRQYSDNYIVSVNYNDRRDRVDVVGNNELGIYPIIYKNIPTGTNVYIEVYSYSSDISSGFFTIIYIGETSSILTLLNYEDSSGSPISLLGSTNATIVASEVETDFNRLRLSWTEYYGIKENTINIGVEKLFNNTFVKVDVNIYSNGTNRYTYLTRSGTYRITFYDSCTPANIQSFGNGNYINLVLLNSVPFTVTYTDPETNETLVTEPINKSVYNGSVQLNLVNLSSYFQTSGYPVIKVFKDGLEYNGFNLSNYIYTFTETGYYSVKFAAKSSSGIDVRQEEFIFSIINRNESRYAYEFAPYSSYYIEKVVKDGKDITKNLIALAGSDCVTINNQKYLSKLLVSFFDERTGAGRYVITVNTGEATYNTITATKFSFGFWINLTSPPINVSIGEGGTTTGNINIKFNAYNLYESVGDCYIKIASDRYDINADTLESIGGENAGITITQSGTYYIQIYSTSNNLLYSYKVIKTDPLNTWAIIAIVIGVLAVGVVIFITIKLRKRLKVK